MVVRLQLVKVPSYLWLLSHLTSSLSNSDPLMLSPITLLSAILCGELSDPENGNVVQARPPIVGSVATYTCKRGFILVGSSVRVCQLGGTYSDQAPTCRGI